MTHRNIRDDIKTGVDVLLRDECAERGTLLPTLTCFSGRSLALLPSRCRDSAGLPEKKSPCGIWPFAMAVRDRTPFPNNYRIRIIHLPGLGYLQLPHRDLDDLLWFFLCVGQPLHFFHHIGL